MLNIELYLREHGIKPSFQRKKILEYLFYTKSHCTATNIYEDLAKEIPSLSKATVYNTLNLFVENDLVLQLAMDPAEAYFEVNRGNVHGHFICDLCHEIHNIPISQFNEDLEEVLPSYSVSEISIIVRGTCQDCSLTDEKNEGRSPMDLFKDQNLKEEETKIK